MSIKFRGAKTASPPLHWLICAQVTVSLSKSGHCMDGIDDFKRTRLAIQDCLGRSSCSTCGASVVRLSGVFRGVLCISPYLASTFFFRSVLVTSPAQG